MRVLPLTLLLLVAACDSVDLGDDDPSDLVTAGILVASQGAFGADDGGVVLFRIDGTVISRYEDLYVQSATVHQEHVFISSTDRLEVLDVHDMAYAGQVAGVPNPRYLTFSSQYGYVTNLYTDPNSFDEGGVTRFSLGGLTADQPVIIGGNPEGIALVGDHLFVANYDFGSGNTVTVLDPGSMQELERIDVGCDGPRTMFVDRQQKLQVVCEGNPWGQPATLGAFVTVDPDSRTVIASTPLETNLSTASLGQVAAYVDDTAEIYAIADAERLVYRFDTNTNTVSATLEVGGAPLNGVDYDPRREYLYIARMNATDPFGAQGTLTVHTRQGALVDTFQGAGVAPTHVHVLTLEEE